MPDTDPLGVVQQRLHYHFDQLEYLRLALTHPSYAHEHPEEGGEEVHNQRLEFLGDAVLDFLVAAWLFEAFPDSDEGLLTRVRATLVRATSLAELARHLGVGQALRLGRGEEEGGGRERLANLCDALEAVVGALYLDAGPEQVWTSLSPWFTQEAGRILHEDECVDPKSRLQEQTQGDMGITPAYRIVQESGPDHAKSFTAEVLLGEQVIGVGEGPSKRAAEQEAARAALANLDGLGL